ncbi:MAG: hypothetical protein IJ421_00040 [Prevotella sp.]|nr:hypothetical protein [Prevotella sp.]
MADKNYQTNALIMVVEDVRKMCSKIKSTPLKKCTVCPYLTKSGDCRIGKPYTWPALSLDIPGEQLTLDDVYAKMYKSGDPAID